MRRLVITSAILLVLPVYAAAQKENPHYSGQAYLDLGFGTGTGAPPTNPLFVHFGGGAEGFLYEGIGIGAEAGIANYSEWGIRPSAVVVSGDVSYHFGRRKARGVDPFMLAGPSFVGPTSQGGGRGSAAVNFGGGANLWFAQHAALRLEFRDVVGASFWNYDHVVTFRVGITFR
jgi:hypothetical protein